MKHKTFSIFTAVIFIILLGFLLNLFFHFDANIKSILDIALYSVIGIWLIAEGFSWDKKVMRFLYILCGLYLIAMNFIPKTDFVHFIAILCIGIPILTARWYPAILKKIRGEKNT